MCRMGLLLSSMTSLLFCSQFFYHVVPSVLTIKVFLCIFVSMARCADELNNLQAILNLLEKNA